MIKKLEPLIGTTVQLCKNDEADSGEFYVNISGTLERESDHPDSFFVRVSEGYFGTSSIGFASKHVAEVEKMSARSRIVLK